MKKSNAAVAIKNGKTTKGKPQVKCINVKLNKIKSNPRL
jgi:hypothetical protein